MPHFRQLLYEVMEDTNPFQQTNKRYVLYWWEDRELQSMFSDYMVELYKYIGVNSIKNGTIKMNV